jgi:hypothetical protein
MTTWVLGNPLETWLLCIYGAATLAGMPLMWRYFRRAYWTDWYDRSDYGYLGKLLDKNEDLKDRWTLVKDLLNDDPLRHKRKLRKRSKWQLGRDLMILPFVFFLWATIGYGILHGIHALEPSEKAIEDQMRLPIFLFGFCTLGATLVGAFFQLRLKARSENRQKWIDEIRGVLAELIADLPLSGECQESKAGNRYFPRHAKLELLLNPSEEVHRTLMALIRHAYGFNDFLLIDAEVREGLGSDDVFQTFWKTDKNEMEHLKVTKSRIIRLSNVVLKREWEQVKHAR